MSVREAADTLFDVERELREAASAAQGVSEGRIDERALELSRKGVYSSEAYNKMLNALSDLYMAKFRISGRITAVLGKDVAEKFDKLVERVYADIVRKCERKDDHVVCEKMSTGEVRELSEALESAAGRRCGGLALNEREVNMHVMIDSVANCVHVIAEELAKASEAASYGKCIDLGGAKEALALCMAWDAYTEAWRGSYESIDAESLLGVVKGDRVQLRVGSAEYHATEIDLSSGKVRYYDEDAAIRRIIRAGLEELGCECSEHGSELMCECGRIEGDKMLGLARVIASSTSMDYALRRASEDAASRFYLEKSKIVDDSFRGFAERWGLRASDAVFKNNYIPPIDVVAEEASKAIKERLKGLEDYIAEKMLEHAESIRRRG